MGMFKKRPGPTDPHNETHEAIAEGCPVASLYYVCRFADGDLDINRYWLERAQAVLLKDLMSEVAR